MGGFRGLRRREVHLMMRDFNAMVDGNDGIGVTLEFTKAQSTVYDEVFGVYDPAAGVSLETRTVPNVRTIQKILVKGESATYDELFKLGALESGDCIFYFKTSINLEITPDETLVIVDPYNVRWIPIPKTFKDLYAYVTVRFQQGGISQVIPCTLEQGRPSPTVPATE